MAEDRELRPMEAVRYDTGTGLSHVYLSVVDLGDPTRPSVVAELPISGALEHLLVPGNRLLVGGSSAGWLQKAGVLSLSLADPLFPRIADYWETPPVLGLECIDARCFIATEQGIWVVYP